jgi:hypothetical protein
MSNAAYFRGLQRRSSKMTTINRTIDSPCRLDSTRAYQSSSWKKGLVVELFSPDHVDRRGLEGSDDFIADAQVEV